MKLSILLDQVLPCSGVLFKHCHGSWAFYKTDDAFEKGTEFMSQKVNESFDQFSHRLVEALVKEEEAIEFKDISIDYAIWRDK